MAVTSFTLVSCSEKVQIPEKRVTTTVSTTTAKADPGSYFLVQKNISVKQGETLWEYARVYYKDGFKWRDIIAQNPFLNQPGRIEKNAKGEWIAKIYPGEKIIMGNEVANLNYTVKENSTVTEVITPASQTTPLWIWLLVGAVIVAVIIAGIALFLNRNHVPSVINVNCPHGQNINDATHVATAETNFGRSYRFREHVASQMLNNPNLQSARLVENSDQSRDFSLSTEYYDPERNRK